MVHRWRICRSITHPSKSVNDTLLLMILIIDWRKWSKWRLFINRLCFTKVIGIESFNIRCICKHLSILLVAKLQMSLSMMIEHWIDVSKELSILGVSKLVLLRIHIKCFGVVIIFWLLNIQAIIMRIISWLCIWFWHFYIQNSILYGRLCIQASVQIRHILQLAIPSKRSSSSISVFIIFFQQALFEFGFLVFQWIELLLEEVIGCVLAVLCTIWVQWWRNWQSCLSQNHRILYLLQVRMRIRPLGHHNIWLKLKITRFRRRRWMLLAISQSILRFDKLVLWICFLKISLKLLQRSLIISGVDIVGIALHRVQQSSALCFWVFGTSILGLFYNGVVKHIELGPRIDSHVLFVAVLVVSCTQQLLDVVICSSFVLALPKMGFCFLRDWLDSPGYFERLALLFIVWGFVFACSTSVCWFSVICAVVTVSPSLGLIWTFRPLGQLDEYILLIEYLSFHVSSFLSHNRLYYWSQRLSRTCWASSICSLSSYILCPFCAHWKLYDLSVAPLSILQIDTIIELICSVDNRLRLFFLFRVLSWLQFLIFVTKQGLWILNIVVGIVWLILVDQRLYYMACVALHVLRSQFVIASLSCNGWSICCSRSSVRNCCSAFLAAHVAQMHSQSPFFLLQRFQFWICQFYMADGRPIVAFSPAGPQWAMQLDIDLEITRHFLHLHHRVAALIALRLLFLFSEGDWLVHLSKTSSSLLHLVYHSLLASHRLAHQSMCQLGLLLHFRELLHTQFVAQYCFFWRIGFWLPNINLQTLRRFNLHFDDFGLFLLLFQQPLSNKLLLHWNLEIWRSNMSQRQPLRRRCSLVDDHSIGNPLAWIHISFDLRVDNAILELCHRMRVIFLDLDFAISILPLFMLHLQILESFAVWDLLYFGIINDLDSAVIAQEIVTLN